MLGSCLNALNMPTTTEERSPGEESRSPRISSLPCQVVSAITEENSSPWMFEAPWKTRRRAYIRMVFIMPHMSPHSSQNNVSVAHTPRVMPCFLFKGRSIVHSCWFTPVPSMPACISVTTHLERHRQACNDFPDMVNAMHRNRYHVVYTTQLSR